MEEDMGGEHGDDAMCTVIYLDEERERERLIFNYNRLFSLPLREFKSCGLALGSRERKVETMESSIRASHSFFLSFRSYTPRICVLSTDNRKEDRVTKEIGRIGCSFTSRI